MQFPVYIINRNRLTSTKKLIDWLVEAGTERIVILDNDSTYKPLLSYYQNLPRQVELKLIGRNGGPWILWELEIWKEIHSPYVVTDSDIVPSDCCPKDLIEKMWMLLCNLPYKHKVGPGLRVDNIPDILPFKQKVALEQQIYWRRKIGDDCYVAAIDTTFAIYRDGPWADTAMCTGVRMDYPYVAEHWPWYQWPLDEEEKYYYSRCEMNLSNVKGYVEEALHGQGNLVGQS